jgi:membrane-associated phospholipid phosphatase
MPQLTETGIDHSRPFMPEAFTYLHGSASYARLSARQRLRYNQLCGVMTAEQFVAFEQDVIFRCISTLREDPAITADRALTRRLDVMLADESRHAAMFRDLLLKAMPEIYRQRDRYFIRLNWFERLIAERAARTRSGVLTLLWFSLAIEEHSVALSRAMIGDDTGTLGPLEPTFVTTHRHHLADELSHLPVNQALIERAFDTKGASARRRLAWIFALVLRNIARPSRANVRVVDHLIAEFPELRPQRKQMVREMLLDSKRLAPCSSITSLEHHPITAAAWRSREEFAPLVRRLSDEQTPSRRGINPAKQMLIMGAWFSVAGLTYSLVQQLAMAWHPQPAASLLTRLDRIIPVIPAFVIPYSTLGAFVLMGAYRCDSAVFPRLMRSLCLAMGVAYAIFLALPLTFDRGPLPDNALWSGIFGLMRTLDLPINTFPSLHVAYVTLVMACRKWSWLVWTWWALIVFSTITTRQHVTVDVIGGIILAIACWSSAGKWPVKPRQPAQPQGSLA